MAPQPASLSSQATVIQSGATLADLLAAVAAADLPARRRHDMASAVRTVARLLGGTPGELPASPRLLANRLADVAPAAHGISQPRWNNLRCLLRAALALLGPVAPGRHLGGLSPGWQALWDPIALWRTRSGVSRFLRFCSAEGTGPEAVDAAAFERFAASLQGSLLKDPAATLRGSRRAWARARRDVAGWPELDLPAAPRLRRGRPRLTRCPGRNFRQACAWTRRPGSTAWPGATSWTTSPSGRSAPAPWRCASASSAASRRRWCLNHPLITHEQVGR